MKSSSITKGYNTLSKFGEEGNLIIVGVKTIDFFTPKVLQLDKTNELKAQKEILLYK
jgi:hypothetical protein